MGDLAAAVPLRRTLFARFPMRNLLRIASLAVLASAALAQVPVTLTGRVERAPASPCAVATHRVACTEILLRSKTLNLATLEGQMVDITGVSEGSATCAVVNVSGAVAAAQSTSTFSLGNYRINSTVIFTTTAPVGSFVAYFFSCEPGFLPVVDFGTLQLNPLTDFMFWTFDVSIGVALRTVRLPNEPGLVGLHVLYQTAFASITPAIEVRLLNAGCFDIR
jgi:hypothetical protein